MPPSLGAAGTRSAHAVASAQVAHGVTCATGPGRCCDHPRGRCSRRYCRRSRSRSRYCRARPRFRRRSRRGRGWSALGTVVLQTRARKRLRPRCEAIQRSRPDRWEAGTSTGNNLRLLRTRRRRGRDSTHGFLWRHSILPTATRLTMMARSVAVPDDQPSACPSPVTPERCTEVFA